ERRQRQDAFGLVADIDHDGVGSNCDHRALAPLSGFRGLARFSSLELGEDILKRLVRFVSRWEFGIGWVRHSRRLVKGYALRFRISPCPHSSAGRRRFQSM